jgi:hypothetical protein
MTHFLFIIVKLLVTWPLNYNFIKKSVLVSNIIIMIPKTFRFWFQPLILIEIGIFLFVWSVYTVALFGKLFGIDCVNLN